MNDTDIELGALPSLPARRCLDGFPSFSLFIAGDKQEAIYRRFGSLSARNLLYQQSELHRLEHELEIYDKEDARDMNNVHAQQRARFWDRYVLDVSDSARLRRELQVKIKCRLKDYRKLLSSVPRSIIKWSSIENSGY